MSLDNYANFKLFSQEQAGFFNEVMEFASIDFSHEFLKVLGRHFPKCAQRQERKPQATPQNH